VLLLYLLTTGLPLQFTSPLNLAGSHVTSPTILDWYGIRPPTEGWRSDRAIQLGDRLYWDSVPLAESTSLGGALRHNGLAVVAGERKLLVFPADDPDLVESIDLPESIQRIGLARDAVVLETAAGLRMMDPCTRFLPATQPQQHPDPGAVLSGSAQRSGFRERRRVAGEPGLPGDAGSLFQRADDLVADPLNG
jgi:hypothetical protein